MRRFYLIFLFCITKIFEWIFRKKFLIKAAFWKEKTAQNHFIEFTAKIPDLVQTRFTILKQNRSVKSNPDGKHLKVLF